MRLTRSGLGVAALVAAEIMPVLLLDRTTRAALVTLSSEEDQGTSQKNSNEGGIDLAKRQLS